MCTLILCLSLSFLCVAPLHSVTRQRFITTITRQLFALTRSKHSWDFQPLSVSHSPSFSLSLFLPLSYVSASLSLSLSFSVSLSEDSCSAYVHCMHCLLPVPYLMGTVRCFVCPLTRIIIYNNNWDNNKNNNNIRDNNNNSLLHALVTSKDCATTLAISVIAARVTRRILWPG